MASAIAYRKSRQSRKEYRTFELILMVTVLGVMGLLSQVANFKTVILNLYFLPVAVSGLYQGRYLACVTALLCVLSTAITTLLGTLDPAYAPLTVIEMLGLCVWASVLGLTALVIGTLSDDRNRELEQLHESHRNDTLSDALTGVANRRAFEYELQRRLTEWNRRRTPLSLTFIDVDHFKKFNDTYGHRAGDAVLCGVAQRLKETIRETDLVARYGGEEFAIIMPDTELEVAKEVSERARNAVEESRFSFENMTLRLTVSVGVAQIIVREEGQSLIERADEALYASKQAGRNCAHVHTGSSCDHFGAALPSAPSHCEEDPRALTPEDAYTDNTTRLPTRKVFVEELKRRLSEIKRYESNVSLMLVQLDELCANEAHAVGLTENVRSVVGEFVRNMMRDSDLVTRFERDQFAVLMPSTLLDGAITPAERLRISVANCRTLKHNGSALSFTVSIGLTCSLSDDDPACILHRAQQALESAIGEGGNRSCYHDGRTNASVSNHPAIPPLSELSELPDSSAPNLVPES